jgi:chromosome segregation ATPase
LIPRDDGSINVKNKSREWLEDQLCRRKEMLEHFLQKTPKDDELTKKTSELKKDINQIETYVANKLKEFSDAHAGMSEELKKMLAQYVADMVKATKNLMGDIQKRQKERTAEITDLNAEVADLLEAFKTEREKMAANWQALTATMAKKRGIKPKVEAEVKVRPVKEAIKEAIEERAISFCCGQIRLLSGNGEPRCIEARPVVGLGVAGVLATPLKTTSGIGAVSIVR